MGAAHFLKSRTRFIRFFHTEGVKPFVGTKHTIENELPPFDTTAIKLLNSACLCLLSDKLKLYFQTLERHAIGFSFADRAAAFKDFRPDTVSRYMPRSCPV